jgi:hypothetical protein
MEFIRYTSKSDIKDLKNHSMDLKDFISNTDYEKDTEEMCAFEVPPIFPKDWSSIYEVTITINEGDITI